MTAGEIAQRLAACAEDVARHLLPGGNRVGREWVCGNTRGGAGKSCKVCLDGPKAGVWSDFAEGTGGDLLDLWRESRGLELTQAMDEARAFLGVSAFRPEFTRPKPEAIRPLKGADRIRPAEGDVTAWLKERGITQAVIDAYRVGANKGVAVFPSYHGEHLMFWKTRKPRTKEIRTAANPNHVLFGWQAIPGEAREVVITEGEIDAMSFAVAGFPALSVPYGGGGGNKQRWIENEYDRLDRFDEIYLSMDMDEEGQKAVAEIVDRLGRHRCYIVELPRKDANECLQAGDDLGKCLLAARTLDPTELKAAREYFDAVMDRFYPPEGTPPGIPTPWTKSDLEHNLRFRPGELTIWTGINGHGKSLILSHVCVNGIRHQAKWCIASMEMMPSTTLMRMYQQAGAIKTPAREYAERIRDWMDGFVWLFDVRGSAKASRIVDVFEYARRRYGVGQFIVDSLAKCGFGDDDYSAQKSFAERLADFAREHECHVHLVAHARKREDEKAAPGKMDVKGSGGITDMADNVLSVWRNKPKEEEVFAIAATSGLHAVPQQVLEERDAVLAVLKQRNHDWERSVQLWFNEDTHRYMQDYGEQPRSYVDDSSD